MIEFLTLTLLAFVLEAIDASLGMGYGTVLTPVLLMMGYDPVHVVPAVIASQLIGDFLAAFFHHQFKNVDLSRGSQDLRVGLTLAGLSLIGSVCSVLFAMKLSKYALNLYIGALVLIVGVTILITRERKADFSWIRLLFLGSIAAFNKGLSGGGYGPIVTAGQILTGVGARSAIAITSVAEGVTCIAAVLTYLVAGTSVDMELAIPLAIGVALSTPVAAYVVSKFDGNRLKVVIGLSTVLLGAVSIMKTIRIL